MKKFLTLAITLLTAVAASAADWELLFGDTPVADGATYQTGYTASTDIPGIVHYTQNSDLYIKGAKGSNFTVKVSTDNTALMVCSFGACQSLPLGGKFSLTQSGTLTDGNASTADGTVVKHDLRIDQITTVEEGVSPADALEVITATVSVYPTDAPTQQKTVTVVLKNISQEEVSAGLINIGASKNYVKLIGSTLHFSTETAQRLNIYSLTGVSVASVNVSGQGALNFNRLSPGMYIYRMGRTTGKFIIK